MASQQVSGSGAAWQVCGGKEGIPPSDWQQVCENTGLSWGEDG